MKKGLYTPKDTENIEYGRDLNAAGEYPYTRGVHPEMYLKRNWTIREFSGFGTAEDTNKRFRHLLEQGETGLSTAFHLPTLLGYDSDHPLAQAEAGRNGVAIDSLKDMEILFKGIPLDKVSTSMTINSTAAIALCMYIAAAEKQKVPPEKLEGTLQNDILKEYIAQNTYIFPPESSVRLVVDVIEYCAKFVPKWNTVSISGYHIREAGATAVQELAFTLANGMVYVEEAIRRGLDVDAFAPRLSFFFDCHNNFFEEIAKFRAARRMWARIMREKFGAKNERSLKLRFHTQTAGCTLTGQQPLNNITRIAIQALAAILGGTQSLHTNSYDEQMCLPSEEAVNIAICTQHIIAKETGVTEFIDPLGGSYLLETLTGELEEKANDYIKKIKAMGGMIAAIKREYPQTEILKNAAEYQRGFDKKEIIQVGVNDFSTGHHACPTFKIDPKTLERQLKRLERTRALRNNKKTAKTISALREAAAGSLNLMPFILEAVKAYATVGEICDCLREVFGEYKY